MSERAATDKSAGPSRGGYARWLWLAALALCFAVFAQYYYGVGLTKTIEIDVDGLRADSGNAWKLKLPDEHRTYAARYRLKVFEDDVLLGPHERSNNRVRNHGSGRYRMDDKWTLRMSTSDNTSPVTNIRKYTLQLPARVKPLQLAAAVSLLLVASFLVVRRGSGHVARHCGVPIAWVAVAVLVAALAIRMWALGAYADFSDGGFSIKGIPFSDAMGWLDQATGLFRGTGFHGAYDGQRPFYSVFLAGAYHLFGESLQTGRVINVACGALSCLFLYLFIAHASGKRSAALAAVVGFLFAQQQLTDIQLLITEPMGLTFIIAGAYAWWAGLLRLNPWALFTAGVLIGLSNVTRTFTMLGLPLFAVITLIACILQRLQWKRTVLVCAMFTLGATCAMGPWMVRQKMRFDTFSLSTAGSDLLYSAALDSPGWNAELYDELHAAGIDRSQLGETHAFFASRYAEMVKEDPVRYFRRLGSWMLEYMVTYDYGQPLTRLAILLAGLFAALRGWKNSRMLVGAGCFLAAAALAPLVGQVPAGVVLVSSVAVALFLGDRMVRWGIVVLVATLLSGAMMSAMIGNFGMNRMMPLTSWVFIAVLFLALETIVNRLVDGRHNEGEESLNTRESACWSGLGSVVVWSMIALSGIATAVVAATGFSNVGEVRTDLALDASAQKQVRDWLREQLPGARETPDDVFFVSVVRLDLYVGYLDAKEDSSHWARPFLPRNYARTVAFVREMPMDSLMSVQFRGRPEELGGDQQEEYVVLAGVISIDENAPLGHNTTMVEGLALIPFSTTGAQKQLDFENARTFPVTPEAATIMSVPVPVPVPVPVENAQ